MNRFKFLVSNGQKSLIAILSATLLSACGGGGGGGGGSDPTPTAPPPSGTTITGAVTKGPLSGATVSFYNVDEMGQIVGAALDSTTTAADGSFSIILDTTGDVLVESRGGSYIDESDEEPDVSKKRKIVLTSQQTILSFLPSGKTTVAITPFTMSLVERARIMSSLGGDFSGRVEQGRAAMIAQLGFDVFTTVPTNPISPASNATDDEIQYALLLGGLANVINNVSLKAGIAAPTYELLIAVTNDLIDGTLDGKQFDTVIQVESPGGTVSLANDVNFINEINRFKNNNDSSYSSDVTIPTVTGMSFPNTAPTANAGDDQLLVARAATVSLDGSTSIDAESGVSYSWSQLAGPQISIANATSVNPSFVAPSPFVGDRTLTFQLVVADALGLIATDTVSVTIGGLVPLTFSVVDAGEYGDGVGEDVDGGGKFILNINGTGQLFVEEGFIPVTYSEIGDVLRIDFPDGFLVDDFDEFIDVNGDGQPEEFLVEENSAFFEFIIPDGTLPLPDGYVQTPNSLLLQTREVGVETFTPVGHSFTKADEPYEFNFFLEAYDEADQIPFEITAETEIVLQLNASQQFPLLFEDEELNVDVFVFNLNGTGITENNQISFNWTVETDGHLNVVFANGESADYVRLGTRASGDIVQTEYNLAQPFPNETNTQTFDVRLSFEVDTVLPAFNTLADAAGIYSGLLDRDDLDRVAPISVRLNPDGTGSVEFEFDQFGITQTVTSSFGVCWSIFDEEIRVKRTQTLDLIVPGSRESTTEFCAQLSDDDVGFVYTELLFNVAGDQYRFFETYSENSCFRSEDPNCISSTQDIKNFGVRIVNREVFTAVPPLTVFDFSGGSVVGPITLNLLANDIVRGLPIDPSTFEIVLGPSNGTFSVDPSNNDVLYTPNAGGGRDLIQYRVRDTAGNLSNTGRWQIFSGQPIAIALSQPAIQGSTATLDGTTSTDNGSIVAYEWAQVGGIFVGLSGINSSAATFVVPDLALVTDSTQLDFTLTVTDDQGLQATTNVTYIVEPKTPLSLIGYEQLAIPRQFGIDVDGGEFIDLNPDGTGTLIIDDQTVSAFSWSSTGSTIDINFFGDGLLDHSFTDFRETEFGSFEVLVTEHIRSISFTLIEDGPAVDLYAAELILTSAEFDVTNGIPLFSEDLTENFTEKLFDRNKITPLIFVVGDTLSLPTNVSTSIATIDSDDRSTQLDELTFSTASTGIAKFKNATFTYTTGTDNQLVVNFADGEVAEYYRLEDLTSGTVVATKYTNLSNETHAFVDLSFTDDPAQFYALPDVFGNVDNGVYAAGVYESRGRSLSVFDPLEPFVSFLPFESITLYHLRPDGTGVLETPRVDQMGRITVIEQSPLGICWTVTGDLLTVNQTNAQGQRYIGSVIPSPNHCAALDNSDIGFQRETKLFSLSSLGEQQTLTRESDNDCGSFGPPPVGCDPFVLNTTAIIPGVLNRLSYFGTPPIARDDFDSVVDGIESVINILFNDDLGNAALDPTTVQIVAGGFGGIATVDPVTGAIRYTAQPGTNTDEIYYRVKDVNGNLSTVGKLSITSMPPMPMFPEPPLP